MKSEDCKWWLSRSAFWLQLIHSRRTFLKIDISKGICRGDCDWLCKVLLDDTDSNCGLCRLRFFQASQKAFRMPSSISTLVGGKLRKNTVNESKFRSRNSLTKMDAWQLGRDSAGPLSIRVFTIRTTPYVGTGALCETAPVPPMFNRLGVFGKSINIRMWHSPAQSYWLKIP